MNSQILFKIGPPNLYKVFILFLLTAGFFPWKTIVDFPWNLIGVPVLFGGIYIATRAKKLFKQSNTPMSPQDSPTQLHQKGLYRYSRNPMYLGIVIGLTGIALLTDRLVNLMFPVIYYFFMNSYFIVHEEANLEKEFGELFLNYKRMVRRWI